MRVDIVHPGAGELVYEIRGIVEFAQKIEATGIKIVWENIGDPVAKGEQVPNWIRKIVADEVTHNNDSFGYSPTKGLLEAREYLANVRTAETGNSLEPDNIMFFNGLGDAITEIYTWLSPFARVLGPSPAYPTHSSLEGAHARSEHLTYLLDPSRGWMPDMKDIRDKVHFDPDVAGLLLINPDNPTGAVYSKEVLEEFVSIAKDYNLFIVADEIYANLAYDTESFVSVASVAGSVPTMVMRGLSKEVPWPGSRCGWVEFYNTQKDASFARYAKSIEDAKMNEVCSTTLPQSVLSKILSDSRYPEHLAMRRNKYEARATQAYECLRTNKNFIIVKPQGAFYLSIAFSPAFDLRSIDLKAMNAHAQAVLEEELAKIPKEQVDKRFCYQLLAATGICSVPLKTGFNSHVSGFRITLLEEDDQVFTDTIDRINQAVI